MARAVESESAQQVLGTAFSEASQPGSSCRMATCAKVRRETRGPKRYADSHRAATLYATVSASFIIEQEGLPRLTQVEGDAADGRARAEQWNGDSPVRRVEELQRRLATTEGTK